MSKTLTLGEMALVEEITGHNLDDTNQPRGKYLAALVTVIRKRTNPEFTLEDAWSMDVTEVEAIVNDFTDALDPKDNN